MIITCQATVIFAPPCVVIIARMTREYAFDWSLDLQSPPEALWPFVADTNRFNHDTGLPAVTQVFDAPEARPGMKRLRFSMFGIPVEWDEQPRLA